MVKRIKLFTFLTMLALLGGVIFTGCENTGTDIAESTDSTTVTQPGTDADGQPGDGIAQGDQDDARHSTMRPPYDTDETGDTSAQNDAQPAAGDNGLGETIEIPVAPELPAGELEATRQRDAFVETIDAKIKTVQESITGMQDQLPDFDGDELKQMATDIESTKANLDELTKALEELKSADILNWETKKELVDQACKLIDDPNGG